MRMSTTQRSSMTKQAPAWVGIFVPYSVLSAQGGDGDVRNRNEQLHDHIGFAGEGISVRSLWGGESGG